MPEADFVGVASGGASLPPWRSVLAAASVFLPRSVAGSDDTAVLALDRDMVATLAALASDQAAGTNENAWMGAERLPEGFSGARIPLGRALGRGGPCRNRRGPSFLSIPPPGCNPESA